MPRARRLDDHLGGVVRQLQRADGAAAEADDRAVRAGRPRCPRRATAISMTLRTSHAEIDSVPTFFGAVVQGRLGAVQDRRLVRHVGGSRGGLVAVDVAAARRPGGRTRRCRCSVGSRCSPVRRSLTMMPSSKLQNDTRLGSSTMSLAGSRPASTKSGGALRIGVLDDVRRDPDHAALAVHAAAAVGEDVERLVVLDPHPGALEHLEGREVDVVELCLGEDVEAEATPPRVAGVQVALHRHSLRSAQQRLWRRGVRRKGLGAARANFAQASVLESPP